MNLKFTKVSSTYCTNILSRKESSIVNNVFITLEVTDKLLN